MRTGRPDSEACALRDGKHLTYLVVDRAYVAAVKAALEEKAAAQDPKPRAGATKLAGQVEIVDWLGHVGTNAEIRLVG